MNNKGTRLNSFKCDENSLELYSKLKILFGDLEYNMGTNLLNSRERSIALTKLEECWMWFEKALKADQEERK